MLLGASGAACPEVGWRRPAEDGWGLGMGEQKQWSAGQYEERSWRNWSEQDKTSPVNPAKGRGALLKLTGV